LLFVVCCLLFVVCCGLWVVGCGLWVVGCLWPTGGILQEVAIQRMQERGKNGQLLHRNSLRHYREGNGKLGSVPCEVGQPSVQPPRKTCKFPGTRTEDSRCSGFGSVSVTAPPKKTKTRGPGGVQFGKREPLLIDPSSAGLPKQFRSVDQETVRAAPGMPIDLQHGMPRKQATAAATGQRQFPALQVDNVRSRSRIVSRNRFQRHSSTPVRVRGGIQSAAYGESVSFRQMAAFTLPRRIS